MNLIEFNKILSEPNKIRKDQIKGLNSIINEYPFFQAAHYLHLKGLKKRHSFKYNDFLKKTAAYTTDRSLLFDNITAEDIEIHPAPANLLATTKKEGSIDQAKVDKLAADQLITNELIADKKEIVPAEENKTEEEIKTPEETLGVGQPLKFKSDESYSFHEWLQLSKFEPIKREGVTELSQKSKDESSPEIGQKDDDQKKLIDKFIAKSPRINPSLYDSYADVAMDSVQENESLMTETLAHVYVEQKKYTKAITAFTILSLKYPEKSSFFAHQIQAVKKLQEK